MEILVFKTNIYQFKDIQKVGDILNTDKDILAWNVDTEDCDKVLRVEALKDITVKVEYLVTQAGFYCKQLF